MIFVNSPFEILGKAFHNLYPNKRYEACIDPDIQDEEGNVAYGFTQFNESDTPIIAISAELTIKDAVEIFAHELAHVAAGESASHGEEWENAFENIFREFNRIGEKMFG